METIETIEARRLALVRAGLLKPDWTGLPQWATGRTRRARTAAHRIIRRFGYLQLDTVSIAGARSHAIVLMSRLQGLDPTLPEELLQPGEPLFEYWGHEASWLPIQLYPLFGFRRREFKHHPWWGDLIGEHPQVAEDLLKRIREEGPIRSLDMDGQGGCGWWDLKTAKRVASALWSSGELAIRERRGFQKIYDLPERVIPRELINAHVPETRAIEQLLLRALKGHGWASIGTLAQTWRLTNRRQKIQQALRSLEEQNEVVPCCLVQGRGGHSPGWIRPKDLELASKLKRLRPSRDKGVLLSPFDPILWDRRRVEKLFGFEQILEIFKPPEKRTYGYYCLPVLAGDKLLARFDLKADRKKERLRVLSCHFEEGSLGEPVSNHKAAQTAIERYSETLALKIET